MRMLLVEDDFASRRLMQKYLAGYGDVDVVVDGTEAVDANRLALAEDKPYDLIFMDIMLPEMDGQEALKHIRQQERDRGIDSKSASKVIMTTALGDPRNVVKAYNEGEADSYLVKPIEKAKLVEEMRKLGFSI